jgi:aminoglycoside phosphotransferase (APT) family kinase protein
MRRVTMAADQAVRSPIEQKLQSFVESVTGGRVISMERQLRWRPAWFVDVERAGDTLRIHIRGDRNSNILPFPELKREADILQVLEAHGIPVPHIWGVCTDPPAIIMDAVPGTRDVRHARSDEERRSIARQYAEAVARMHKIPVEAFVQRGIELPQGAEAIALAGLTAYAPLYAKTKKRPEPLIELALRWLKSHVPRHRTRAAFIQFDSGQFLFDGGKLTALYDFEFAMIGDPMTDLATMRMRESYEPLGDELRNLYRCYEAEYGEPIDVPVLRFHNALFAAVSCMQISGAVADPQPGGPHAVYLEWDLALRRALIAILAECMGVSVPAVPAPQRSEVEGSAVLRMLQDAVGQIDCPPGMPRDQQRSALALMEYAQCMTAAEADMNRLSGEEAAGFLGRHYTNAHEREAAMERFVQSARADQFEMLLQYFARQIERQVLVVGATAIGGSASRVAFSPVT